MSVKFSYESPLCQAVNCEMNSSLLTGGSPVSTAMTISLIDFGSGAIDENGGEL